MRRWGYEKGPSPSRAKARSTSPASGRGEECNFLARLRERWHAEHDGEGILMTGFRRTMSGGRINRAKPVAFTYNGKPFTACEGDTVASALLANDQTVIARSFKYHRPRSLDRKSVV